jgi:hypothetical protein
MKFDIRNKIIIHDKYFDSFLKLAVKEGYATPFLSGAVESWYESEVAKFVDFYGVTSKKKELLQMMLIFDEISFINPVQQYDLSRLQRTGLINIVNDDRAYGYLDFKELEKTLLIQIKPVIISRLRTAFKDLYNKIELKNEKISFNSFLSFMYDYHMLNNHELINPSIQDLIIRKKYLSHLVEQASNRKDAIFAREMNTPEDIIGKMVAVTYSGYIQAEVGTLLSLLDMSSMEKGILMQSEFKFNNIKMVNKLPDFKEGTRLIEGYQILRMSYEKIIGMLPALDNIDDVLKLKDKKHKEIKNLQEVLYVLELDVRNGRVKAIRSSDKLISGAVKDLNRNQKIQNVSKWITYLSVPIGIIETILQFPPIIGVSAGITSYGTTLFSSKIEKKNNWLSVIR